MDLWMPVPEPCELRWAVSTWRFDPLHVFHQRCLFEWEAVPMSRRDTHPFSPRLPCEQLDPAKGLRLGLE